MARQPLRSLRVPDRIWNAAMTTAADRGESLNAAANRLLAVYGGVDAPAQPWTSVPAEVLSFGSVLVAAGVLDSAADTLYYTEKPYKWDDLHDDWVRCGRPAPPERGVGSDAAAWESFVASDSMQQL